MPDLFPFFRPLIHAFPAETAHNFSIAALAAGLLPPQRLAPNPMLQQTLFGLDFSHPVGMAPGFDKNAEVAGALFAQGFSFVEVGTVTPKPQPGNPKPRLFRLSEDEAVINRMGFNNKGLDYFVANLQRVKKNGGMLGANIGKNKDSVDAAEDYVTGLQAVYPFADYITVNISSPNTPGLRSLQKREALGDLLSQIAGARAEAAGLHGRHVPLLLKIAPDLEQTEKEDIAEKSIEHGIDALIVSNTTVSRPPLGSCHAAESGGLSGRPLFALSTAALADMYRMVGGKIPLVGVGGIASPEDAYAKILAGASLVQLYSALVFQGFGLVRRIHEALPALLARDGFTHISQAVGARA